MGGRGEEHSGGKSRKCRRTKGIMAGEEIGEKETGTDLLGFPLITCLPPEVMVVESWILALNRSSAFFKEYVKLHFLPSVFP